METLMTLAKWPVQDAKAKFSELLDTCVAEGPQMVTHLGVVCLNPFDFKCA